MTEGEREKRGIERGRESERKGRKRGKGEREKEGEKERERRERKESALSFLWSRREGVVWYSCACVHMSTYV